mmetsp:Transcript_13839/g.25406  ORF Transcript_13839/g.25406 Transcript_13839/m.25406 type:complete len:345 (-) Transcript_13839:571-1605(-)
MLRELKIRITLALDKRAHHIYAARWHKRVPWCPPQRAPNLIRVCTSLQQDLNSIVTGHVGGGISECTVVQSCLPSCILCMDICLLRHKKLERLSGPWTKRGKVDSLLAQVCLGVHVRAQAQEVAHHNQVVLLAGYVVRSHHQWRQSPHCHDLVSISHCWGIDRHTLLHKSRHDSGIALYRRKVDRLPAIWRACICHQAKGVLCEPIRKSCALGCGNTTLDIAKYALHEAPLKGSVPLLQLHQAILSNLADHRFNDGPVLFRCEVALMWQGIQPLHWDRLHNEARVVDEDCHCVIDMTRASQRVDTLLHTAPASLLPSALADHGREVIVVQGWRKDEQVCGSRYV